MRKLVVYLVRKHLGLKKFQYFQFENQKTDNRYYFTEEHLMKIEYGGHCLARVSLNYLLSEDCEITTNIKRRV